jgi:ABC-type transport system involved in multi-copper enzyme maturation permease subunit
MSHYLTLLKTEYIKRKSSYWLPVWIVAGIVLLVLIISITAMVAHWDEIEIGMINMAFDYEDIQDGVMFGTYGSMILVVFVFSIFLLIMSQSSLSKEKELGCELFYRCQPVNIWVCTAAKYLMHVFAGAVLLLGTGLILGLIMAIVLASTMGGFYLGSAIVGSLLGVVLYLKIALVFGSLLFLFSSIFKNNAFLKGAIFLGLIDLVFFMIEEITRNTINMPSIYEGLVALLGNLNVDADLSLGYVLADYRLLIALVFAGACYAGATLIYKYKTIEA